MRALLNDGRTVDIVSFDKDKVTVDGLGELSIEDFNSFFLSNDEFKKRILGLEIEVKKESKPKKQVTSEC